MISIIILTYNSEKYIEKLLDSLLRTYKKRVENQDIEILIADNASTDNTLLLARKYKKHVKITDNGGNVGFAKGNNLAVHKTRGEYIVFLNPDSEFVKGDVEDLSKCFKNDIGVVGGKMVTFNGDKELSCGRFYSFINILLLCLGLEETFNVRFSPQKDSYVDFVSGGFMMVSKKSFLKIGGFDEHYFMYVEDQDLCFRMKEVGLKTFFSTSACVRHMGQGSSNRTFAIVNIYKGLAYFQKKNMNGFSFVASLFVLKSKAYILYLAGTLIGSTYLKNTYGQASKVL